MRAAPTITSNFSTASNVTGQTIGQYGAGDVKVYGNATATGICNLEGTFTASADL